MILKKIFKLMNHAFYGKTMENVRKHRDIKLVTTERRRIYLVSEPDYGTAKFFIYIYIYIYIYIKHRNTNKLVYLGFSILELSRILICISFGMIM